MSAGVTACNQIGELTDDSDLKDMTMDNAGSYFQKCVRATQCNPQSVLNQTDPTGESTIVPDPDTTTSSAYCSSAQSLADALDSKVGKEKAEMDSDNKALQELQTSIIQNAQTEARTEQQTQQQIVAAQQKLQEFITNSQDEAQKADLQLADKLNQLQGDLQKLRDSAQSKMTAGRQQIINQFTAQVRAAQLSCANNVTSQAQKGQLQYANTAMLMQSSRTGSVPYQCSMDRQYRYTVESAQNNMLQALQQLQQDYNNDQADIARTEQQMANELATEKASKNSLLRHAQLQISQTTQNIQQLTQQLTMAQQQFQQQQQVDQMNLAQKQQEAQQSASQYASDYKNLQTLEAQGYVPQPNDTKANSIATTDQAAQDGESAFEKGACRVASDGTITYGDKTMNAVVADSKPGSGPSSTVGTNGRKPAATSAPPNRGPTGPVKAGH